jgi:large subunit ribosomal protein L37Ae
VKIMAKRTQKAGATARFGARYGVSVRRRAGSALSKKSRKYTCPSCHYPKVRRKAAGIWECRKCDHTFSGGVWEPYTRASDANKRIVRRSLEGATATDMTVIAQQAALDFERKLSERDSDAETEEE